MEYIDILLEWEVTSLWNDTFFQTPSNQWLKLVPQIGDELKFEVLKFALFDTLI